MLTIHRSEDRCQKTNDGGLNLRILTFLILFFLPCALSLGPLASVAFASATVTVAWDKNQESEVTGYKVHYGTVSKNYQYTVDVKNNTSCSISGLEEGRTYFFAATAYNNQNVDSSYSKELAHTIPNSPLPPPPADTDGDGLLDDDESGIYGTDPNKTDTDGDGINDSEELDFWGDDWDSDFDSDGLINLLDKDSDNDGYQDGSSSPTPPPISPLPSLISEDFEAYTGGENPVDWLDTAALNSMVENDSLFEVFDIGGNKVFGTVSTMTNIHSHYVGSSSTALSAYEYTGRMMVTASNGGIGVTFLSQYPVTDAYYRLRRYGSNSFHISPHGTNVFGDTDTGVVPTPNKWYWFRIEVQDTGSRTEIQARVWPDGDMEPSVWQVNAYDNTANRLVSGTFGVWSYLSGSKYWDDLRIINLMNLPSSDLNLSVISSGNGSTSAAPDRYSYTYGENVTLTATADPGWEFSGWSGDLTNTANPATITMDADMNVTANFVEIEETDNIPPPLTVQYTLTVNAADSGNVNLSPAGGIYDEGTEVQLTATAAPGWEFNEWSGDLTDTANPVTITVDADMIVTANFTESVSNTESDNIYEQDFAGYAAGSSPDQWLDTRAKNSMVENDSLFKVFDLNGEKIFGTASTQTNIHSHHVGQGVFGLSAYEYTGRMMMTNSRGGIGVTFLSQYPNENAYYRLRRYRTNAFHIAPHGTKVSGDSDTGVVPLRNVWYRFRVQVEDTGTRTKIRARVWPENSAEPATWQADCYDESPTRLTDGTIGLWSYYSGSKYWDDLSVSLLSP